MKKTYMKPEAEKLEFNYNEMIVASGNPMHHSDMGIGVGGGSGCDHDPGHGTPHKPHPHFPNGKP